MEPERVNRAAPASPNWQLVARTALAATVVGVGAWILFDFLPALAWAAVLAIAIWPVYRRLLMVLPRRADRVLAPAAATLGIGVVVIAPLVLLGMAVAHETHVAIKLIAEARHHGIPVPEWIPQLPFGGTTIAEWWQANLTDPVMAEDLFSRINLRTLTTSAREFGGELIHRVAILLFTLLTLFFLFRDGVRLAEQVRELSDRLLGMRGERIASHMVAAVHGTVTGLVLVGLVEGFLLGIVYVVVDLPYPAIIGAVTGVAAIIPFAAPIVYTLAGVYLFTAGNTIGAVVIIIAGSVVVFVADHFVRPVLIGGAARLPFLLVLLGLLGGLETMGFLGLFLGPAVMAALVALWREWTETADSDRVSRAAARGSTLGRRGRARRG